MVALSDIRFLAKDAAGRLKGIAGSTITVALATLAEGLSRDGNISSDARGAGTTVFTAGNSGAGVCDIRCDGKMGFQNGTGYRIDLVGTPTANRTITFPDASGTVSLGGSSSIPSATNAAIHALTPTEPVIYYCTDIPGLSVGVVGALVYYNTLTPGWMRVSNDAFF